MSTAILRLRSFFGPKRPKGPSFFEIRQELEKNPHEPNLNYALELSLKYGELVYIRPAKQYLVTGPEGFNHILKENAKNYTKNNTFYRRFQTLFGHSLLTGSGEYSKYRRKIAMPAFHAQFISHYVPTLLNTTESQVQQWLKQLPSPINILSVMNRLTLNIAFQIFAQENLSEAMILRLSKAIHYTNGYISHALFIKPWKPTLSNLLFYWHRRQINTSLKKIIEARRKRMTEELKPDLLSLLLNAKHDQEDRLLNNDEILDEFKTLVLTGHETTGCTLTWLFYLLAEHPDWQEKAYQELKTVLEDRSPTLEDLSQLPLLNAIFLENLRLYPPIWNIPRIATEKDELYGYEIPKNSILFLNIYALHRHPNYWEDPTCFKPERFLGETAKQPQPNTFLPFITGSRSCVASHLAQVEAILIAAKFLQKFKFDKHKKTKVLLEPCISLRPKNGLWLTVTPR